MPLRLLAVIIAGLFAVSSGSCSGDGQVSRSEKSVQKSIAKELSNAASVRVGFEGLRTELFNSAWSQAVSIVCSSWRVEALADRDSSESVFLEDRLVSLFALQEFASYRPYRQTSLVIGFISIEASRVYDENHWSGKVGLSDGGPVWVAPRSADLLSKCREQHEAPIPNASAAKALERKTYAAEILGSLKRLRSYSSKLPAIEIDISRVRSVEAILDKLNQDLRFDLLDTEIASMKLEEYAATLNSAADSLQRARREVSIVERVDDSELGDILSLFSEQE